MKKALIGASAVILVGGLAACAPQSSAQQAANDQWDAMSPREQEQSCAAWTLMGGSEVLAEYDAFQNSEYGEAISAFSDQGTDLTGEHDRAFLDLLDKNC